MNLPADAQAAKQGSIDVRFYTQGQLHTLEPGDVLLYHGCDVFARAIQYFDETPYYHAGLLLDGLRIAEAVMAEGVSARPLADSFRHRDWAMVRRYAGGRPSHQAPGRKLDPVVARARSLVTQAPRYAFEQLLPLALLLLTRKVPRTASFGRAFVGLLEAVIVRLRRDPGAFSEDRETSMFCSAFVVDCFDKASEGLQGESSFALDLEKAAVREAVEPGSVLAEAMESPRSRAGRTVRRRDSMRGASRKEKGDIEDIVGVYLDEAQGTGPGTTTRGGPRGDRQSLVNVVWDLASALDEAHQQTGPLTRGPGSMTGGLTAGLSGLVRLANRLVTPGDLGRSPSLHDVGVLHLEGTRARG